ncbi:MAG: GAF domain-containing protein [Myxococcaceae bacterium]|nr:GAF domain-containing protein [Myxococcaceae bacterium]
MAASRDSDAVIANPLKASGLIDSAGLDKARKYQAQQGGLLSEALLRLNLIKENDFLKTFAELYATRFVKADKLKGLKLEGPVVELVSVRLCERMRMCPIRYDTDTKELHVVAAVPLSSNLEPEVKKLTGAKIITVYVATAGAVDAMLRRWHYAENDAFDGVTPNGAGRVRSPAPIGDDTATEPRGVQANASDRTESAKTLVVALEDTAASQGPPATLTPAPGVASTSDAQTIAALRKENARYRIAQEFHRLVAQERTREAMVERILKVVFELVPGAESSAIWISATGELQTRTRQPNAKQSDVPRSVIDQAVMSANGVLVHNALVDERFDRSKSMMLRGVQSVMAVPLRARSRTFGVLYVDSVSHVAAFSDEELATLDSIGAQASLLLDNAELIAKVQQEAENRVNLSRFLSAAAVEEVLSGAGNIKLDGTSHEVTVLFADIRGFTTLSSELKPEEVVEFLNRFFEEMVEAVLNHKGTIDKFIGDCIMALWGAPQPNPAEDARNAMAAALSMVQRSKRVQVRGRPIEMGVGINTGQAVLGCIGSKRRLEYTAIGSSVNLGARLCGIAKPNEVLVTADTLMHAGPGVYADANEPVLVKGIDTPIVPYTLRGLGQRPAPIQLSQLAPAKKK